MNKSQLSLIVAAGIGAAFLSAGCTPKSDAPTTASTSAPAAAPVAGAPDAAPAVAPAVGAPAHAPVVQPAPGQPAQNLPKVDPAQDMKDGKS